MSVSIGKSRIRVVHVTLQLDTGGMEKLLVQFARHADRTRFDLRFLSMTCRGEVADELEALGCPVDAMNLRPGVHPGFILRMFKQFRQLRPDVVHVHNTKPLMYCGPAARLAGVQRVVYTRHGQRYGYGGRRDLLFRWAARTAHATVCVSRDSAARSRNEGLRPDQLHIVWNGIDTEQFVYTGPMQGGPAVMVGRLSPEKDVDTLLAAAVLVVRQHPSFRLQIAGAGSELERLRQKAHTLGIQDVVQFLGNVSNVPELMGRASLCVLSSITEGISLVLLEAMSRGLPVIATSVGGNPEIILDGITGLLVPARNPEQLAAAISKVWSDRELGVKFGREGHLRVATHFDVRRMVADYERLYLGYTASESPVFSCTFPCDSAT